METLTDFIRKVNRRRVCPVNTLDTDLQRYMTTFDLVLLGIAHVFGVGIFIVIGFVAKTSAGPAVVLSILIAAICALLSAVNYIELSSRVPRSGSAYIYVYMVVGEVWAFLIGWSMLLEYVACATSAVTAFSGLIDATFDNFIQNVTVDILMAGHEWQSPHFVHYPNILAGLFICLFTGVLLCGISTSSKFINIMISCMIAVLLVFFVYSLKYIDVSNWNDYGGFMPTGFSGVIAGAAKIFFLFASFELICTSSEECIDPMKSLPIALVSCILVYALFSIATAICLTLIVPWTEINELSPIPEAFLRHGDIFPTYLITIGVFLGITGCGLTAIYGLTRLAYAIAVDKLLFSFIARLSQKTPTGSILFSGIISLIVAVFLPFDSLIDLLNIGSLISYNAVAAVVVVLRYRPVEENHVFFKLENESATTENQGDRPIGGTLKTKLKYLTFLENNTPGRVVLICLATFIIFSCCWLLILFKYRGVLSLILITVFTLGSIISVGIILMHHQNQDDPPFKVPCVPFVPLLSILCNIALLVNLPSTSWIRFFIWLLAGLIIYFSYGYRHSNAAVGNTECPSDLNPDSSPLLKDANENADFGSTKMVVLRSQGSQSSNDE